MYRTSFTNEQVDFIKSLRGEQLDEGRVNNQGIGRKVIKKFGFKSSVDSMRKRVAYLTCQFEEEADRPDAMNNFIKKQNSVGRSVRSGWIHDYDEDGKKTGTWNVKNPHYEEELRELKENILESMIPKMEKYAPKYPKIKRKKSEDGHLLVVDIADLHIGKLCTEFDTGDTYNSNIAIQRALEGVDGILAKSNGFNIDRILFIAGNDILHTDNPRRTTTSGTPQDTDLMWHQNYLLAHQLYVDILEKLISIADVDFLFCPSNHDYTNGFFLAKSIEAWFRNSKNISFQCNLQHRKYYQYGLNMIGASHGDGAKEKDLPLLMADESPKLRAESKHRYIYLHHLHHKISKDYIGVTVEYVRSASGSDRWHSDSGYKGVPKAIEGYIHHKRHGQCARITHIFH